MNRNDTVNATRTTAKNNGDSRICSILPIWKAERSEWMNRVVEDITTYRRYGGETPGPQHEHRRKKGQPRREHRKAKVSPECNVFIGFPVARQQVTQHALLLAVGLHCRLCDNIQHVKINK